MTEESTLDLSLCKKVGKYTLVRKIGSGSFAKVKEAIDGETGEHVAVKIIDKKKIEVSAMAEQLKREITTMKLVNHENIVQIREVLATKHHIYIVMELVSGGDLLDKIELAGFLDEQTSLEYFRSIVTAIDYCHKHDVFHRDLKPENVLVSGDDRVKITDFGMSVLCDHDRGLLDTMCGTANYVAPEVVAGRGYDGRTADVWSLGCILYVMLSGALPFDGSKAQIFDAVKKGDFAPFPRHVPEDARTFIKKILTVKPENRITIEKMMEEPFFNKYKEDGYRRRKVTRIPFSTLGSTRRRSTPTQPIAMNAVEVCVMGLTSSLESHLSTSDEDRNPFVARMLCCEAPSKILTVLAEQLSKCAVDVVRVVQSTFKVKGEIDNNHDPIKFTLRLFELLPPKNKKPNGVYVVDVRKTQGSTAKFRMFYNEFCNLSAVRALTGK